MIQSQNAGGVVVNPRGEIALVQNGTKGPWWGFPKGHIDEGEDVLTAARREIFEETGIADLTLIKPLGSYERHKGAAGGGEDPTELKHIEMFLFTTNDTSETLTPHDPQNPEARWVIKEKVAESLSNAKDRAFFIAILGAL